MIVSITCRHGTEDNIRRNIVDYELKGMAQVVPVITRSQVVFSKESNQSRTENLATCHLSVHLPKRHSIDIYEHQANEMLAFDRAKERAVKLLARNRTRQFIPQKRQSSAPLNSGVYPHENT